MLVPTILTLATITALALVKTPVRQTEWMRGATDAQAMVERQGLAVTTQYFEREVLGWDFDTYEHGWQDYLWSLQARLQDVDYTAAIVVGKISRSMRNATRP